MKKALSLILALAFTCCVPAFPQSTNPVISQTKVAVHAMGNPAHLGTNVSAQFTTALASVSGNSAATTAIQTAQSDASSKLSAATSASTPAVIVNYSWTITTKLDGTVTVTPDPGNTAGVRAIAGYIN